MLVDPNVNDDARAGCKSLTSKDKTTKPSSKRATKHTSKRVLTKQVMVESAAHLVDDVEAGISHRLQEAMRYAGVSNGAQIAREVGCTRAAINKYLRNPGSSVEAHLLFRIADYLNVDPRWLLEGVGSMTNPTTKAIHLSRELQRYPEWLKLWMENGEYMLARQQMRIRWRLPGVRAAVVDRHLCPA